MNNRDEINIDELTFDELADLYWGHDFCTPDCRVCEIVLQQAFNYYE